MDSLSGKFQTVKTEGDFEKFLQERGVPFAVRKILAAMNNGGKMEVRVEEGVWYETEIGMFSNKELPPQPSNGDGVDAKTPTGDECVRTAKLEGNTFTMTETMKADPTDTVTTATILQDDGTLKRVFTNGKTGTSWSVSLNKIG